MASWSEIPPELRQSARPVYYMKPVARVFFQFMAILLLMLLTLAIIIFLITVTRGFWQNHRQRQVAAGNGHSRRQSVGEEELGGDNDALIPGWFERREQVISAHELGDAPPAYEEALVMPPAYGRRGGLLGGKAEGHAASRIASPPAWYASPLENMNASLSEMDTDERLTIPRSASPPFWLVRPSSGQSNASSTAATMGSDEESQDGRLCYVA